MISDLKEEEFTRFFFDTYAFLEILRENKNYSKYINSRIITTKLNIFELYLKILREDSEENAKKILEIYYPFANDFDEEIIKMAAHLKKQLNKRNVSMTDSIGYCLAQQLGIKFLTGDTEFENMDGVEFVK